MPGEPIDWHISDRRERAGDACFVEETDRGSSCLRGQPKEQQDTQYKSPVANPVGDESLLGGRRRFLAIDVVADEQIRAETDAFPTDEHQKKIIRQHEREHRKHEQIQVSEEAIKATVAVHVASRENVNQKSYECNEQRIDPAQAIHGQAKISAETPDLDPSPEVIHDRLY